jgi:hypothetical protein
MTRASGAAAHSSHCWTSGCFSGAIRTIVRRRSSVLRTSAPDRVSRRAGRAPPRRRPAHPRPGCAPLRADGGRPVVNLCYRPVTYPRRIKNHIRAGNTTLP